MYSIFRKATDRAWEQFGEKNPYYGVLTHQKYRQTEINDEALADFFDTGERYIQDILMIVERNVNLDLDRALDFGCGVGRLIIPIARRARYVLGVDISHGMRCEAEINCERFNIENVSLKNKLPNVTKHSDKFDLVHTYITLQHIRPSYGKEIFRELVDLVKEKGVGIIHVTFSEINSSKLRLITRLFKRYTPGAIQIANVVRKRPIFDPDIEMNNYDLNFLFLILYKRNCEIFHISYTNHSGHIGLVFFFKKK